MRLSLLFIDPPQNRFGICLENRALLWLASDLKKRGITSRVISLGRDYRSRIRESIAQYRPKAVAVSCKWYTSLYGAVQVAREIKKTSRDVVTIAGGHTASYFDRELLENSEFDIVVRGDAEVPLANIITGEKRINCTEKKADTVVRHRIGFVQSPRDLARSTLADPSEILEDPRNVLNKENFIWVGKGCRFDCFFCGGSASATKRIFSRTGSVIRPVENVIADIDILSRYSPKILFDFSTPYLERRYYPPLFKKIAAKDLICSYFSWGLPDRDFIERLSESFQAVFLGIDSLSLSETLRKSLCEKNLWKTFHPNRQIEKTIAFCSAKSNIRVGLYNIAGLPGESERNVQEHIAFAEDLAKSYLVLTRISYRPLSVEPGSRLHRFPDKYGMACYRTSYSNFLSLSKTSFFTGVSYPYENFKRSHLRKEKGLHPFGACEQGSSEAAVLARVRRFHSRVDPYLAYNASISGLLFDPDAH